MPIRRALFVLIALLCLVPAPAGARDESFEKAAPWDGVRFVDDGVEVRVEGTWYALVSIDGAKAADVLAFSRKRYGRRWDKRFKEDLVEVLAGMDKRPGKTVDLVLRDKDGKEVTKRGVAMTHENRQAVRRGGERRDQRPRRRDDDEYPKLAPWDAVRWDEDLPDVRVEGAWYTLLYVNEVSIFSLLKQCKYQQGSRWKRRFEEDLVQIMTEMGAKPGRTVDLRLMPEGTEESITKRAVPMTAENRRAILEAAVRRERAGAEVHRVKRSHADKPDARYAPLVYRVKLEEPAFKRMLTSKQAQDDLDQLEWHITHEHSYAGLNDVDYRAALDTIRLGIGDGISKGDLALQLHRVICLFGDGHARVRGLSGEILGRDTHGFELASRGDHVLLARWGPRDGKHPYAIQALDGVPVARWQQAVEDIVPRGSAAFRRLRRARDLRYVPYIRARLGLPANESLQVEVASVAGGEEFMFLREVRRAQRPHLVPPVRAKKIGDVGYLQIVEMSGAGSDIAAIDGAMRDFKDTKGLVVDVRGNGGGSRDILRALFPYFMRQGEMHVANVAAYRIPPGVKKSAKEGYLQNRYLHPATSSVWSAAERKHVEKHLASFAADMVLPEQHFSAWHVMLLTPEMNPNASRYHQRVVVLMDGGCFSATDIFLGAFKGWRGVTLMGTPSGGGSGRSKRGQLAHSGIRFRLSTMASFQPTGERYDGKGIQPDVVAEPKLEDIGTEKDSVLKRALATAAKPIK